MRLAGYNVENLFARARAMNRATWDEGRDVLGWFATLNSLLGEVNYTPQRKQRMLDLFKKLGLERSDEARFVRLRQNRGALLKRPRAGGLEIVADGRADWAGSLELVTEPIDENAMRNTARVIRDVGADILAVVEAESRPSLCDFNAVIIGAASGTPYKHVMLIDGNDRRGIDVGLMLRPNFVLKGMCSHVDDVLEGGSHFARDCPSYDVETPGWNLIVVMIAHLKSKGFGSQVSNNRKRRAEASRIKELYQGLRAEGREMVAVLGDFNDNPNSEPLAPLLGGTDLKDVFQHGSFDNEGHAGTFDRCKADQKFDYILLSPELWSRVQGGGVFRKGMWPGSRPPLWEAYDELLEPSEAASDHAAVWVDLDA